ncbi:MAG TPA: DUF6497 family protein [Paracoccaceae bacterium]|nr:DUF6497 family protein [Paracoccaceae bacterium]
MTGPLILPAQAPGAAPAPDAPIPVPSGQEVRLLDVIRDQPGPGGLTYRFRFVAPAIAQSVDFETAAADMEHLCRTYALPRLSQIGPVPAQVIVSLADRPVAFGEAAPEVTQFFEAYRIEDNDCIWEAF